MKERRLMNTKETIIIGIAGGSGSGKSTFTSHLEDHLLNLKVKVIHMDDYFKEDKPTITAPYTQIEYEDHNHPDSFDFDKLLDDYKQLLKQEYDVIIIEGLMTLYNNDIRKLLHLKIFIDCQADERIVRRINRNLAFGQSFEDITSVYLDAVRYRHQEFVEPSRWHADIILNGSSLPTIGTDIISTWIKSQYSRLGHE